MAKYDKLTCLVVDDYSTARRIIKNNLHELGFTCLEAEDGEDALGIILQTPLNLVLADVKMPNKNGWNCWRISEMMKILRICRLY